MWNYEKRLEYPVNITTPNPKIIMSQYGGPDGEMGASMRYLSQRFTAPNRIVAGVLNDIGRSVSLLRILWLVLLRHYIWIKVVSKISVLKQLCLPDVFIFN